MHPGSVQPAGPIKHVFVYGTLRIGSPHPMAHWLAARAAWRGQAWCAGALYSLGDYPGLVITGCDQGLVRGDLFRLKSAGPLARLDAYEGCAAGEYRRLPATVTRNDETLSAWIYVYCRSVRDRRQLRSGDWLFKAKPKTFGCRKPRTMG